MTATHDELTEEAESAKALLVDTLDRMQKTEPPVRLARPIQLRALLVLVATLLTVGTLIGFAASRLIFADTRADEHASDVAEAIALHATPARGGIARSDRD